MNPKTRKNKSKKAKNSSKSVKINPQTSIINALDVNKCSEVKDLEKKLNLTRSTVLKHLRELQKLGYIHKLRSTVERRTFLWYLKDFTSKEAYFKEQI